ncbi:MAG TPA: hypothetical protein VIR34_11935 [Gemmatimonadaceae bacterium]|jgi:hypothetical protein
MRLRIAPRIAAVALAASLSGALPCAGHAQELLARADSLMNAGRVFAAESIFYYMVRRDPRNPAARLALGRYLAARGALKVGAVLMEEARYFGGDPATVANALVPVYEQLGDYASLAALPASPLDYAERRRAEWLRDHPPGVVGPDSAIAKYEVNDTHLLGELELDIGADSVRAVIEGRVTGLVLDTSWIRRDGFVRFASRGERDPSKVAAVAREVRLGEITLTNVPVRFEPLRARGTALLGLDVLGALAPTFHPAAGRVLLRKEGRVPEETPGFRIPTLATDAGVFVVKTQTIFPVGHPDIQQVLRHREWTLNPGRGEIIVPAGG